MIPRGLRDWFAKSICVIPVPFMTIRDALSGGGQQNAPKITTHILEELRCSDSNFCTWVSLPRELGAWKLETTPAALQQVCAEALSRIKKRSCMCSHMRKGSPNFGGFLDHVVIRSPSDWSHILEPQPVRIFTANARNQFFPDPGSLRQQLTDMTTALQELAVSQVSVERCQFVAKGIFEGGIVQQTESTLWEAMRTTVAQGVQLAPWLNGSQIYGLRYDVSELQLRVTVWDKKLTKLGGLCSQLYDTRLLESTIFGSRFQLWGWADSPAIARLAITHMVIKRARECGIINDMLQRRLGRACFALQEDTDDFLFECFIDPQPHKRYPSAPAMFSLPKWKSTEYDPDNPVLKWRDIVSYKSHALQSYSRVISRALQLLCAFLHSSGLCVGFPNMLGVRDQIKAIQRFADGATSVNFRERDMDDMFWQIERSEALQAISWAIDRARSDARGKTLWFSIAKGLEKDLDRFGKNSAKSFVTLSESEVLRFVEYDMTENVFLTVGSLILYQGARGIPIGGFLSAQIAEIWACWKEFTSLFGENVQSAQRQLTDLCADFSKTQGIPVQITLPGTVELIHHSPDETVLAHDMFVSRTVHLVTPETLCQSGFSGWWSRADRTFATAEVAGHHVRFIHTLPWDGAEGGRLQSIVRHSTRKNKRVVMQFFRNFDALNGVVGEILSAETEGVDTGPSSQSRPVVIMSRYRDNIYFAMAGISPFLEAPTLFLIEQLTAVLYNIPLKWEPHGSVTTWGEASMLLDQHMGFFKHSFGLQRKGVVQKLSDWVTGTVTAEWENWVDAHSPNARMVLRSLLPSLLYKSVLYALNKRDVVSNMRSLLWGLGVKRYPDQWWRPALHRFFHRFRLHRVVGFKTMMCWYQEGRQVLSV